MFKLFYVWLIIVTCSVSASNAIVAQEQTVQAAPSQEKMPFVGKWKVISQMAGTQLVAVPNNNVFLLTDMIAEYDRSPNKAPVPEPKGLIALHNTKWSGKDNVYNSCMYRSPSDSFEIEPFSDKNIAAYCYLQIRNNSAILVISQTELKTDPFRLDKKIASDTQSRVLTLYRVIENAKSREHHIGKMTNTITTWFGSIDGLGDDQKRIIGGFLDEQHRNSISKGSK